MTDGRTEGWRKGRNEIRKAGSKRSIEASRKGGKDSKERRNEDRKGGKKPGGKGQRRE